MRAVAHSLRRTLSRAALMPVALLAGCAAVPPPLLSSAASLGLSAQPQPELKSAAPPPAQPAAAPASPVTIAQFKPPVVTLYLDATGTEAQRVPRTALPVPMPTLAAGPDGARVLILTLDGPRWVAVTEVDLAPASQASRASAPPSAS